LRREIKISKHFNLKAVCAKLEMGNFEFLIGHNDKQHTQVTFLFHIHSPKRAWKRLDLKAFYVGEEKWRFCSGPFDKVCKAERTIYVTKDFNKTKPFEGTWEELAEILGAAKAFVDAYKTKKELEKELAAYRALGEVDDLRKFVPTPGE